MTIEEFIRARLDEDEAIAQAAIVSDDPYREVTGDHSVWRAEDNDVSGGSVLSGDGFPVVYAEGYPSLAQAEHIARHDPDRVLRQVAALREVVRVSWGTGDPVYEDDLMQSLAAIWEKHPDYRPEWTPDQG